jgi:cytochrome c peroxidase
VKVLRFRLDQPIARLMILHGLMRNKFFLTAIVFCAAICRAADLKTAHLNDTALNGRSLFDKETFSGNGRTCATCHGKKTGTVSIDEIQERFAKNPNDSLFRSPDSDDLDGLSFDGLLATGTIRIDVPLAPGVKLVADPSAATVTLFRGTPSVRNVTTLQTFLMSDGRESNANLQHQALSAVHQHTQNSIEPTSGELDRIADFERTDERFFSSEALRKFAAGGPPPELPAGKTAAEKRGREFFNANRQCGICHSGPMLDTSSEFDVLIAPGSPFHAAGAGLQLGHNPVDADGNFILEPTSPNANQAFEFAQPDGSTIVFNVPDPGRALITGDPNDVLNFKIATLWGIKDTAPYFHDNSARTLEDVLHHYQRLFELINDQVPELFPIMTEQEQADVIAFLKLL